jgi:hypothetical protein
MEDNVHVVFGKKKIPSGKKSVKRRVVTMQQPSLFLQKLGATSLHIFTQLP